MAQERAGEADDGRDVGRARAVLGGPGTENRRLAHGGALAADLPAARGGAAPLLADLHGPLADEPQRVGVLPFGEQRLAREEATHARGREEGQTVRLREAREEGMVGESCDEAAEGPVGADALLPHLHDDLAPEVGLLAPGLRPEDPSVEREVGGTVGQARLALRAVEDEPRVEGRRARAAEGEALESPDRGRLRARERAGGEAGGSRRGSETRSRGGRGRLAGPVKLDTEGGGLRLDIPAAGSVRYTSRVPVESAIQVGTVLKGRYRITGVLGQGGMGSVYRALDCDLRRVVVVKAPHPRLLTEAGARDRFVREIQSLTGLDHPHIVKIFDAGEIDGMPYAVLQYLSGQSLKDLIEANGGRLTPGEVMAWLPAIAEALDFVHRHGVVHRDVKPTNILFDAAGHVFLADFGIAKALGTLDSGLTQTGVAPGSPRYMAPEAGADDTVTPAYDQYSLAVVVYEALCGRLPHEASNPMRLGIMRTLEPPEPLSLRAPHLANAVCNVVMRALQRDPAVRFAACVPFASAFEQALRQPPAKSGPRVRRPAARAAPAGRKARLGVPLLLLMLVVAAAGVYAGLHALGVLGGTRETASRETPRGHGEAPGRATAAPASTTAAPQAGSAPTASTSSAHVDGLPSWANVAAVQLTEAARLGVSVALEDEIGIRYVLVPGGTFTMGSPDSELGRGGNEGPQHEVTLSPFYLAITETTNAQYRRFRPDHRSAAGFDADDQPVTGVSHHQATAFVEWLSGTAEAPVTAEDVYDSVIDRGRRVYVYVSAINGVAEGEVGFAPLLRRLEAGERTAGLSVQWSVVGSAEQAAMRLHPEAVEKARKSNRVVSEASRFPAWTLRRRPTSTTERARLPTEAEWEYGCRAGTEAPFSFGQTISTAQANYNGNYTYGASQGGVYRQSAIAVGTLAHNQWGLYDMHGNVSEYCSDWRGEYPQAAQRDPKGPGSGTSRAHRGGSWRDAPASLRAAFRTDGPMDTLGTHLGFRVALSARVPRAGDVHVPVAVPPTLAPQEAVPAPAPPVPEWAKVSPEQIAESQRLGVRIAFEGDFGMRFVLIPGGTFLRGSPDSEEGRNSDEGPQHEVTVSSFYMTVTEVTNAQYRRKHPDHSSGEQGGLSLDMDSQPAVHLTWNEANDFAAWLGARLSAHGYRLPTEAEWEYASRAGAGGPYWWGSGEAAGHTHENGNDPLTKERFGFTDWGAWAADDGHRVTAPVGSFPPNRWGLYDVLGNAWEWCQDWYAPYTAAAQRDPGGPASGSQRVHRGGSWWLYPHFLRLANRGRDGPEERDWGSGFRLVATILAPPGATEEGGEARAAAPPVVSPAPAAPAPPAAGADHEVPGWAKVSKEQIAEASRIGKPVAFENEIGVRFVLIPGGSFWMGSPGTEAGRDSDEGPQHRIELSPFYLSVYETTNAQYQRFDAGHDSGEFPFYSGSGLEKLEGVGHDKRWTGEMQPVGRVSHNDAIAFVRWLSARSPSRIYALPTEAQWECAARAATTAARYWGETVDLAHRYANANDPMTKVEGGGSWDGWPQDDGYRVTAPVGSFMPNAWGLYDMLGNAWEWCSDWKAEYSAGVQRAPSGPTEGSERVLRGGGCDDPPSSVRAACRLGFEPNRREHSFGFRIACTTGR